MLEKTDTEESVELWGERFQRSPNGLDEEQVKSFVNRLISEREKFLDYNKHVKSLTLLAENTIKEADNLANKIRRETEEDAHAQAKAILEKAKEEANELIRQKRIEAEDSALKEAESIRANAVTAAQKYLKESEEASTTQARAIILRAMMQGNDLIEQRRIEAETVVKKQKEAVTADILEAAQKRLKETEEAAEAQAQAQARAILSSFRPQPKVSART